MIGLLASLILIPMAGAFLSYPLKSRTGDRIPALAAGLTFIIGIVSIFLGYPHSNQYFIGQLPWLETKVRLFGFLLDPLSSLMLIVITAIGVLVVIYSAEYLSPRK